MPPSSCRILISLILAALVTSGCLEKPAEDGRIGVVVSIPPQAEYAQRIGGEKVRVSVMVPPGASPHTYEPKPSQLAEVARAAMYAKVGSGIEFELAWMDKVADINGQMRIVDCSQGIGLIESEDPDEPGADVHIWTSVANAKVMVENIYTGLAEIDPENREYYKANKEEYVKELSALDEEIRSALAARKNKEFIVYHPAWAYFARDYGLIQIPIEKEGKDPTPKWMECVIKEAKDNNITVVFASPEFSTASAEAIAKEIGGKVVTIDPLSGDYLVNMRRVAETFENS